MKKIILDENLPHPLRHRFPEYEIVTVYHEGWVGIQNGELLQLIGSRFDVFLTADKKLRYQQNLRDRKVAIIELPSTRMRTLEPLIAKIESALKTILPGDYIQIE